MKPLLLIHHAANRDHDHPAGSLSALRSCLEAGALIVELDIIPLLDQDFCLFHDPVWDGGTTGSGPIARTAAETATNLQHTQEGSATEEPVGLLSQAVEMVGEYPRLEELQLDLKPYAPLNAEVLKRLLRIIEPIKHRVRVTSEADWAIRDLRALDADLQLGFDPLLYLDLDDSRGEADLPPFRMGAYGYRDDHPLASRIWGAPLDYLRQRAKALAVQAPPDVFWYIRGELLGRTLDEGFDWIEFLHERDCSVAAWTLDPGTAPALNLARRLADQVDRITTNNAPELAAQLDVAVQF